MRLVVDPVGDGQKVMKTHAANERFSGQTGERLERAIDGADRSIRKGRDEPAGTAVEEFFRAVDWHRARHAARNARITAVVSAGALKFGQCPVAFN